MKKIIQNIYWIGVTDAKSKIFHGIDSPLGGSYNSYFINDEKPTVIDCTNKKYFEKYIKSVEKKISPEKIEYIVINHAEPDHAGAISYMLEKCPKAKVVCTEKCKELLIAAFDINCDFVIVKDNDTLNIGSRELKFIMDPLCHWPETMMTYSKDDKMLFSGDVFGTEIAHNEIFCDQYESFQHLTRDYFALIMRPFVMSVKNALKKVRDIYNSEGIDYIAPSHGPTYRGSSLVVDIREKDESKVNDLNNVESIVDYYDYMCGIPEENKILIVYGSIWNSTEKMAYKIAEGIISEGFEAKVYNIEGSNFVNLMSESLTSKAIVIGSLTMMGGYYPLFDAFFNFLKLNRQQQKNSFVFGTYGWCSAAVPKLKKKLEEIQYKVIDTIDLRFGPKNDEELIEFGRNIVNHMR